MHGSELDYQEEAAYKGFMRMFNSANLVVRPFIAASVALLVVSAGGLLGCGSKKPTTNTTSFVNQVNAQVHSTTVGRNVSLQCPTTVTGGVGTKFNCTISDSQTGKSATVQLEIGQNQTIQAVSNAAITQAAEQVATP